MPTFPGASKAVEKVAHRGAPRELRENTLPSFQRALDLGADAIELDAHLTSDGQVVVHHDDTVQGLAITQVAWSVLSRVDLGDGDRIPLLRDVLDLVGERATVYIELKGRNVDRAAVAVARDGGRRFAFHSFDHGQVERVARDAADVALGLLFDRGRPDAIGAMRAAVAKVRARDVWPHWSLVDEPFMDAARDLGVRVVPWTVNDAALATRLEALGVAAICTDDLGLLR